MDNRDIIICVNEDEDLLRKALAVSAEKGKTSTNYLKNQLNVGYDRAKKIIDCFSESGVIEKPNGKRFRKLLIPSEKINDVVIQTSHDDDTSEIIPTDDVPQLTSEELEAAAKAEGAKLGALIYASRLTSEQKDAWISVLPYFSLEQIDTLLDIFENRFASESLTHLDHNFEKELKGINDGFLSKEKEADEKVLKQLKTLTQSI